MEHSLGLLKPDCLKRGLEKEVIALIGSSGLKIVAMKRVRLTKKDVDIIWSSCRKMKVYEDMVNFSLSGDCIVFIVEGKDAINRLNNLVGHYDPLKAEGGTVRRLFGTSLMENIIHSAFDKKAYKKEKSLFFKKKKFDQLTKKGLLRKSGNQESVEKGQPFSFLFPQLYTLSLTYLIN